MEDGRMPPFQTVMESLSPTKSLPMVPIGTELAPLPIGIAAENDGARVFAAPDGSAGERLPRKVALMQNVQSLNPKWRSISHTTILAKRG